MNRVMDGHVDYWLIVTVGMDGWMDRQDRAMNRWMDVQIVDEWNMDRVGGMEGWTDPLSCSQRGYSGYSFRGRISWINRGIMNGQAD